MNSAEGYIHKRLDLLSDDKAVIVTKNKEIEIEINEIHNKITNLKSGIDDAYDVFSPRGKKNDFEKKEIEICEKRIKELSELQIKYNEQIKYYDEEINIINNILTDIENSAKEQEIGLSEDAQNKENDITINGINIVKGQEYEIKRVAMELHDSTVQVLTNLVHKCEICSKVIDVDSIRAKLELEVMAKTLRNTINELRNTIYNLRPMSFDDMGLDITLERIVNQSKKDSDIQMELRIEGEKRNIGETQSITIVRVLQEALSNSKKHSNASKIKILLQYLDNGIKLKVSDDGKGFDVNSIKRPEENNMSGFGLAMMREKVKLLNGIIDIDSKIDEGTNITVTIFC